VAAWRKPGPIGRDGDVVDINDGTLVRNLSPLPGPSGHQATEVLTHKPISLHRQHQSQRALPILQEGMKGQQVRWAQILLNQHEASDPPLKVDGIFGPKTRAAVVSFQRSKSLKYDGMIGVQTWTVLVATGEYSPISAGRPDSSAPKQSLSTQAETVSVADWPLTKRFEEVLKLAPNHMGPELAAQFRAMLTPTNISIAVGTLAVWAVSQAFGVGEIVDLILLVVGAAFIGLGIFKAGEDLGDCMMATVHAKDLPDLDRAADYLAQAVVILGVTAFFALLAKVAGKFARGGGAAGEEAGGGSSAAAGGEAAPKPPSGPKPPKVLDEPEPAPAPKEAAPPADPIAARLENSVFNGVKADRIRPGTNGQVAVIGRSMGNAVEPYSKGLDGAGFKPETFSGDQIPPDAVSEWNLLKKQYAPNPIPDDVVKSSQMFKANQAWAQKLADKGYTVVDVDNPGGQGASPFYEMEKQTLFGGGGK
jgi:Putative peptidoglycan binding domain